MFNKIKTRWGRNTAQFIFILMLLGVNQSLYSGNEMKNTPDTLTITEHNNGDTLQVSLGTILILKLEANPGTGYAWHSVKSKPHLLTLIEEPKFEPKKQDVTNKPLGAPEYNVLRYCAQNAGREVLELGYLRGWEKNKPPLKTFSITVSIRK